MLFLCGWRCLVVQRGRLAAPLSPAGPDSAWKRRGRDRLLRPGLGSQEQRAQAGEGQLDAAPWSQRCAPELPVPRSEPNRVTEPSGVLSSRSVGGGWRPRKAPISKHVQGVPTPARFLTAEAQ